MTSQYAGVVSALLESSVAHVCAVQQHLAKRPHAGFPGSQVAAEPVARARAHRVRVDDALQVVADAQLKLLAGRLVVGDGDVQRWRLLPGKIRPVEGEEFPGGVDVFRLQQLVQEPADL